MLNRNKNGLLIFDDFRIDHNMKNIFSNYFFYYYVNSIIIYIFVPHNH